MYHDNGTNSKHNLKKNQKKKKMYHDNGTNSKHKTMKRRSVLRLMVLTATLNKQ